jgi:hypothetical protein
MRPVRCECRGGRWSRETGKGTLGTFWAAVKKGGRGGRPVPKLEAGSWREYLAAKQIVSGRPAGFSSGEGVFISRVAMLVQLERSWSRLWQRAGEGGEGIVRERDLIRLSGTA